MPATRPALKDDLMKPTYWGLDIARAQAQHLLAQQDRRRIARQLIQAFSTNDPEQRVRLHNLGRGARYTRGRRPVALVYAEAFVTRGAALRREYQVKRWSRARKKALCSGPGA